MNKIEPRTLKGFRDFLPVEARKRQYVINTLKQVFELYGFEPLETPALEYEEILTGKYGEEGDKLMYRFEDNGKRRVALRYDQTVPTARVVAQYGSTNTSDGKPLLPFPFKRYQVQPVWRAENTQKGRFREFLQCDADVIGVNSALADSEVINLVKNSLQKLGFKAFKIIINDRANFVGIDPRVITIIDKLKKIGKEGVLQEIREKGLPEDSLDIILNKQKTDRLNEIMEIVSDERIVFDPTLARGLDYYTGLIFEVEVEEYAAGSVCGGGRYDNLIGMFADKQIPAVGFAFGFDRLLDAMEELDLFPANLQATKVLITIFSPELKTKSLEVATLLRNFSKDVPNGMSRSNNINTELYLDETAKMERQLKYANQKGIPYVIIIGPDESAKATVQLKNMETREQKEVKTEDIFSIISNN